MSILGPITAGGQTWAHRVRMFKQVLRTAIFSSISIEFVFFFINISKMPSHHKKAIWYTAKAKIVDLYNDKMTVDSSYWYKISRESFSYKTATVSTKKKL